MDQQVLQNKHWSAVFYCSYADQDLALSREKHKKLYVSETPWGMTRQQRKLFYAGKLHELEEGKK